MLTSFLTSRTLQRGGGGKRVSTYTVDYNKQQAESARDALIKSIYTHIFDWIVVKVNGFIAGGDEVAKLPYASRPDSNLGPPRTPPLKGRG